MAIWSALALGLGKAAISTIAGRQQAKAQNRLEMNKYANLRKAAEKGGFHPLSVLQAGGSVNMQAAPRLLTSLSANNAFDALENEITGEGARQRRRQEVQDELNERQLEIMKMDIARQQRSDTSIATNRPPKIVGAGGTNSTLQDIAEKDRGYHEQMLPPDLEMTMPEEVQARPLMEPLIGPDGTTIHVPEDIGQAVGFGAAYPLVRLGRGLAQSHQQGLENATSADVQKVRDAVRKNNPDMTDQEVEDAVRFITTGKK